MMTDDMALVREYVARPSEGLEVVARFAKKIEDGCAIGHDANDELRRHGRANLRTDG
jgi:hypothetical protein